VAIPLHYLIIPIEMCSKAGSEIQDLAKSVYEVEAQATGLRS
jgi:hypothetical protein